MFGSLGVPELIFIFALALLIFGPRKLPEIGRTIGRGLSEFRKASTELKRSINAEMIEEELRQSDPRRMMDETTPSAKPSKTASSDTDKESAAEPKAVAPPAGSVPRSSSGGSVPRSSADDSSSGGSSSDENGAEAPAAETPAAETPASSEAS